VPLLGRENLTACKGTLSCSVYFAASTTRGGEKARIDGFVSRSTVGFLDAILKPHTRILPVEFRVKQFPKIYFGLAQGFGLASSALGVDVEWKVLGIFLEESMKRVIVLKNHNPGGALQ
jgi:hypothetical protein